MKKDLQIILIAFIVTSLIVLLDITTVTDNYRGKIYFFQKFSQTKTYEKIAKVKDKEFEFFSNLKKVKERKLTPTGEKRQVLEQNLNNVPDPSSLPNNPDPQLNPETGKLEGPLTYLIVGDSLMIEGFGPRLEAKLLSYEGTTIIREGKYSTGLNRIDYFDWYAKTEEMINVYNPDILIVMFGANDGQGIYTKDGSVAYQLSNPKWDIVYAERVNDYLLQFKDKVKYLYWVGHPIAKTEEFQEKFKRMNAIYSQECSKYENTIYINTWDRFTINGQFAPAVADDNGVVQTVKTSDGVHVTTHGGNIMADVVIGIIKEKINLVPKTSQ